MIKSLLLILLVWTCSHTLVAQKMRVSGRIADTLSTIPLPNAVVMAIKLSDSSLIKYTRTDASGNFKLDNLSIDTLRVIVSHPRFGDLDFYVFGKNDNFLFDFGTVSLPPPSITTAEVVIYAYKDPVYYKGDTLIYTADSFKVKPNAVVEDLLKKLPGVKVDAAGAITTQGKKVDKVLVDGDEFFGADPTIATRNLAADAVESVKIYEKKDENGTTDSDTQNILDLKLKADAKKGYFGKATVASDFRKFNEGQLFYNKFNSKTKISVFSLASNTPRSGVGFQDAYKYGLQGELNSFDRGDDDDQNFYYSNSVNENNGVPRTLKTGFYYDTKISKKAKFGANYTYRSQELNAFSNNKTQYFLTDTAFNTNDITSAISITKSNNLALNYELDIDSFTNIKIKSAITLNPTENNNLQNTIYTNTNEELSRSTNINNNTISDNNTVDNKIDLERKFRKKGRNIKNSLSFNNTDNVSTGFLISKNTNATAADAADSLDQKNTNNTQALQYKLKTSYTEPLSLKSRMVLGYAYGISNNEKDRRTLNNTPNGYTEENTFLSNSFSNNKRTNSLNLQYVYDAKKHRLNISTEYNHIAVNNYNKITLNTINQSINNVLPRVDFKYRPSENGSLDIKYSTAATQPTISQLQPLANNTNPNQIQIGNPNLLPGYRQTLNFSYNNYKILTKRYIYSSIYLQYGNRSISNAVSYDSQGRTITQAVNTRGNSSVGANMYYSLPIGEKFTLGSNFNSNYNKRINLINNQLNISNEININPGIDLDLEFDDLEFGGEYSYNFTSAVSSISSANNQKYSAQNFTADGSYTFLKRFNLETDATYTINSRRANGYNINFLIWNASLSRNFLKTENLVLGIQAIDILNQNTNYNRTFTNNTITDSRTNVIGRYILLELTYKFNSKKQKEENDFDF